MLSSPIIGKDFRAHAMPSGVTTRSPNAAIRSQSRRRYLRSTKQLPSTAANGVLTMWGLLWIIIVGFVAGLIARWLSPGPNNPTGFILTTVLGIAGAFLATFIGQAIGWYRVDQGAGFIAATLGALIVLFIWNRLVVGGALRDPGNPRA
jgi:uncharacterized membrane protein YeaQ/YmgE (transglycosylase-associated protein family)